MLIQVPSILTLNIENACTRCLKNNHSNNESAWWQFEPPPCRFRNTNTHVLNYLATGSGANNSFDRFAIDSPPPDCEAPTLPEAAADAVFAKFISISGIKGVWSNSIAVSVGDKYVDRELGTIWEVLIAHTTASSGTFLNDHINWK